MSENSVLLTLLTALESQRHSKYNARNQQGNYYLIILFDIKCTIFKWQQLIDEVGDDCLIL